VLVLLALACSRGGEPDPSPSQGASGGSSSSGAAAAVGGTAGAGGGAASGGAASSLGDGGTQQETATGGTLPTGSGGKPGAGGTATGGQENDPAGPEDTTISWGTDLQPPEVVESARMLAASIVDPGADDYRAKGDQHRTYHFEAAGADVPFRLCVPTDWDGESQLPLAMFLHGAGNDESSYLDQNGKQMVTLAEEHDYVLVSPLGYEGAYGSYLRLPAVFGELAAAEEQVAAAKTPEAEALQRLSEQDVINVLEIVLAEYPIQQGHMVLMGHSMGSGGTWYIGGKYSFYWDAIAPMSGPFVQELVYPWERMMDVPMFVSEGTSTASVDGSRALRDFLEAGGYPSEYLEVEADHPGMVPLVLPDVFDFFDRMND